MPDPIYRISDIKSAAPKEGAIYLLDANVWLMVLQTPADLNPYEKAYIDFFDAVINLASNPKCKHPPKIFLNELIISEVYNAYMRSKWEVYSTTVSTSCPDVKAYRGTNDFLVQLANIKSDFRAYEPYVTTACAVNLDPLTVLAELPTNTDYNDNYYTRIAVSTGAFIITNDKDFAYPDVEIITNNGRLLSLMKKNSPKINP